MGKKSKQKKDDGPPGGSKPEAQPKDQNPQAGAQQGGQQHQQQRSQQGGQQQQQQRPQQGGQQQQKPPQGGGGQQQQQRPQQGGQQQQQKPQQSAWGGGQQQQQMPQQGGQQQQKPQQGARGGGQQQQQQQRPQQGGQQQQQQMPQQGGQQQQKPQQGAWGGGQQQQQQQRPQKGGQQQQQQRPQQGGQQQQQQRPQQGGQQQQQKPQQGAWGGGQQQQQQQRPQKGGQQQQQQRPQQGGQQQQQQRPQQGGQQQQQKPQQGAWGGGQQQQQQQKPQQGGQQQQQKPQQGGQDGRGQQHQQRPSQQQGGQDRRGQQFSGDRQSSGGYGRGQQQGAFRQQGDGGRGQQQRSETLQQKMGQLSISNETPLPVKEKSCNGIVRGTLGRPGVVEVNYLRLDLENMPNVAYHYDVTITPDRPKKFLRPAFEQFFREKFPDIPMAFDGMKSCYTLTRLNGSIESKIEIPDSGNRMKEFTVSIKETDICEVDLSSLRSYQNERVSDKPMRALQVLEVVLASNNHERGTRVGRSFFRRPSDAYDLQDGYEAWTGLYQAAILGEMPLINVDISHKSFPCESSLLNYLQAQRINNFNNDISGDRKICSFLKGINIIYTPPQCFGSFPKQYKVLDVGETAARKKFKTEDGKEQTVAEYYRSRGYPLQYPNLNCLTVGSTVRSISLPMELCSIPGGQALNRKDQERQVQNMIRYAATSTNRRKDKIMELLRYFDHNDSPLIREFGLRIGSNFIKVPTRLLTPPMMAYLNEQTVSASRGAWRMDNMKFLITAKPPNGFKWSILYEESQRGRGISYHEIEDFKKNVISTSSFLNMNLQKSAEIIPYTFRTLQSVLKDLAKDKYDLVFVVLNEFSKLYAKTKQIAELDVGILTQCIKEKTVQRTARDRTVFSNILLKVNGKLNGTNHKIVDKDYASLLSPVKNVMYLGADVTHPSPDQRHIPSVVGVAASHDPHGACYNCQYRLQKSTVEIIEDMETITQRHLEVYRTYQRSLPTQIIYYRDGVSDGQFPHIEQKELPAIKRACKKMGCDPKITCIIVVKRHHTRFFPMKPAQHDRDFNNVDPGTVVDQYITHPNEVQFFMVSHQSIQGTAKPTRYNVIVDESKFDINLLQKLTYNLCHLFPRCNRAVSYPAPAYLAHLVAFRGRVYLEGTQRFDNLRKEYERRLIRPEFLNRNPMYFI